MSLMATKRTPNSKVGRQRGNSPERA